MNKKIIYLLYFYAANNIAMEDIAIESNSLLEWFKHISDPKDLDYHFNGCDFSEPIESHFEYEIDNFKVLIDHSSKWGRKIYIGNGIRGLESSFFQTKRYEDGSEYEHINNSTRSKKSNCIKHLSYVHTLDSKKGVAYKFVCLSKGDSAKKCYLTKFTKKLMSNNCVELEEQEYKLETVLLSDNCNDYIEKIRQLSADKSSQPIFEKLAEEIFEQETKL